MTAAVQAQIAAAKAGIKPKVERKACPPISVPSEPIGGRDTPKEAITAKPCAVRWQEASGLFRQQHPGMFRIVIIGHENDKDRVLDALTQLNQ